MQIRVIQTQFSILSTLVVPGPEKLVKMRPEHFSVVLTRNDKKCTSSSVGMFRLPNRVKRARFSKLPALVVSAPEKVVKIRSQHFLAILTGNHRKGTQKGVGMILGQN